MKLKKLLFILIINFVLVLSVSCSGEHEHTWDNGTVVQEASCTRSGIKNYHCTYDGCGVTREEIIPQIAHDVVVDEAVEATCTTTGLTEGSHCKVCGTIIQEQMITGSKGHVEVIDRAVDPTCTTLGLTQGSHCEVCNEVLQKQEEFGELIEHNFVDKVCTMCGSTDYYTVGLLYKLNEEGNGYIVTGGAGFETEIVIPSTYKGLPVTEIGVTAFFNYHVLKSVTIPDSVTVIGDEAFNNCINLEEVIFSDNLTSIGELAFFNCDGLTSLTIPSSVTSIGKNAFSTCNSLESIVVEEGNEVYDSRDNCNAIIETATNKLIYASINTTAIPDGVTTIGEQAFMHLYLPSIIIPKSVVTIEKLAFEGIQFLANIYYYGSETEWNNIAIDGSNNISNVTITYNYLHTCVAVVDEAVAPTCTTTGLTEGSHCSICNKVITTQEEIEALGHVEVVDEAVAPTCSKTGLTEGSHCSRCNKVLTAQNEVAATGNHTAVVDEAVAPTCTTTGLTEGSHCSVCNKVLVAQEEVKVLGHDYEVSYTWDETKCQITLTCKNDETHVVKEEMDVKENVITKPTCLEEGSAEYTATYTLLDKTYSDKKNVTLEALGHDKVVDKAVAPTCTTTGLTEGSHCSRCDVVFAKQEELELIECKFEDGKCSVCGSEDYYTNNLTFKLNEDGKSYTVIDCENEKASATIPAKYKGLPVIGIADEAFKDCSNVSPIIIGENVKTIGKEAFANCASLSTIVVPNSVETIGFGAFKDCDGLSTITLPFVGNELDGKENTHLSYIFGASMPSDTYEYMPTDLVDVIVAGSKNIADNAFSNCSSLEIIALSESIETIGSYAFSNCSSLESIIMSSNIKEIKEYSFISTGLVNVYFNGTMEDWCNISFENSLANPMVPAENFFIYDDENMYNEVKKVVIPDTVTKINDYQFYGFNNVNSIQISEKLTSVSENAFNDTKIKNIYYDGTVEDWCNITFVNEKLTSYLEKFYMLNESNQYYLVTEIEIPNTVTKIGDYQFYRFTQLKKIEFEEDSELTTIGVGAFYLCSGVTDINLPSKLTTIDDMAFTGCTSLKNISIPNSIEKIGNNAFYYCNSLEYYTNENGLYLGNENNKQLVLMKLVDNTVTSFEINDNTKVLYDQAFYNCQSLESLDIPDTVVSIGSQAFYYCKSLSSVTLPSKITNIGDYTFCGCSSLTEIEIPETVTSIGDSAFCGTGLIRVEIPSGVTKIEEYLFSGCSSLTEVVIPEGVTSIEDSAFSNCSSLESITIPGSVTNFGDAFFGCESLESIYYDGTVEDWCNLTFESNSDNPMYYANALYLKNESNEYYELTELVVPNTITQIGAYQFAGFENLTSVTLPDSVVTIEDNAFSNCTSLTEVEIGNGLETIGEEVFYGCTSLESITLPLVGYSYFGYLFGASSYESNSYYVPTSLKEVVITNCETIKHNAFDGCESIESISIPDTVNYIGEDAFLDCGSLKYNTNENGLYLGNEDNPYVVLIDMVDTNVKEFNILDETKVIYSEAFKYCTSLQSIVIPNTVKHIGFGAFEECRSLKEMSLPFMGETFDCEQNSHLGYIFGAISGYGGYGSNNENYVPKALKKVTITRNITKIGVDAFYACSSLTSITLPDSIVKIGSDAFYTCSSLVEFVIPASVEYIGGWAFSGCSALTDVYYNNTLENWCNITFKDSGANPMISAEHLYMLDEENEYYELSTLSLPEDLTEIGNYQFYNFDTITKVEIPSGVIVVGEEAFAECSSLTDVIFDDSSASIGEKAFYNCSVLANVDLGNNISRIGDVAFGDCSSLKEIVIPNSVERIGESSFYMSADKDSSLESITLPFIGETKDGEDNSYFGYIFGSYLNIPSTIKEIFITDDITTIGDYAFRDCDSLTTLEIPNTVTSIGEYAFTGCSSLKTLVIPDSVTTIGKAALNGCSSLESITLPFVGNKLNGTNNTSFKYIFGTSSDIPTTLKEVKITGGKTIGVEAFRLCGSIESVIILGVESIGVNAFSSCKSLKNVTLGIEIAEIGFAAFDNCDALTNVYYFGSEEEWENITISDSNEPLINAYFKYNFHFHIAEVDEAVAPTCTETGLTEGSHCSICNEVLVAQKVVEALGHTEVIDEAVASTCEKTGLTEGSHCGVCNEIIKAQEEVALLDHVLVDYVCKECGYNYYTEGLEFTLNEDGKGYSVSKGTVEKTEIIIPAIYNGLPVVTIDKYAFEDCSNVEKIIIPNSVTSIGYGAFYGCEALESITLPFTGNTIDGEANTHFGYIFGASYDYDNYGYVPTTLKEVKVTNAETIKSKAFYNCRNITSIIIENTKTIETQAFYNCSSLTEFVVPDSVTTIDYEAFKDCTSLESITLPFVGNKLNGTENTHFGYIFGAYGYYDNRNLPTSLKDVIVTNITSIDDYSFYYCENLTSITLPENVENIGEYAFAHCSSLVDFEIPTSVTTIQANTFMYCSSLTSMTISENITSICQRAFEGCNGLISVEIPSSVTQIDSYTFLGCTSLESITLPFVGNTLNGTENTYFGYIFGASSYYYNSTYVPSTLKEVIVTNATVIGDYAFYDCANITSITLPENTTSIGAGAFEGCSSLVDFKMPEGVESIKAYTFRNCSSITSIEIPEKTTSIENYTFEGCSSLIDITLPKSVESIGEYSFNRCSSLTSVVIPNGVTSIGDRAFKDCSSLESITLPFVGNKLNGTENTLFGYIFGAYNYGDVKYCVPTSLKEVVITNDTVIDDYAFYNCDYIESIIINEGVTTIEEYAFSWLKSLKTIVIPSSIETVGYGAFVDCQLENVYYMGTVEQWGLISFDTSNQSLTSSNITYNYVIE